MALGAKVIVFYTLMGGFLTVAWTDLFQWLLMVFVSVLLPFNGGDRKSEYERLLQL